MGLLVLITSCSRGRLLLWFGHFQGNAGLPGFAGTPGDPGPPGPVVTRTSPFFYLKIKVIKDLMRGISKKK